MKRRSKRGNGVGQRMKGGVGERGEVEEETAEEKEMERGREGDENRVVEEEQKDADGGGGVGRKLMLEWL